MSLQQPPVDILSKAIEAKALTTIRYYLDMVWAPPTTGQSGTSLAGQEGLARYLEGLEDRVSERYSCPMFLRWERSSYRVQMPSGVARLELHQDYDVLHEEPHDPAQEPCCTVWVPLVDIDNDTPTLQVVTEVPSGKVEHHRDENNYSIASDTSPFRGLPTMVFSQLAAGDGVIFGPLTLHRTLVRPWHTKVRHSFDLRFTAYPGPIS